LTWQGRLLQFAAGGNFIIQSIHAINMYYIHVITMWKAAVPLNRLMVIGGAVMKNKKSVDVKVGRNVKLAREKAEYTQEKFGEIIGMSPKNLSDIERGVVGISISTLEKICTKLFISCDSLIMENQPSVHVGDLENLTNRLKRLSPQQFDVVLSINNKLLEAFAIDGDNL
jgi:transcriptional regulator with XRE-family HTH domain